MDRKTRVVKVGNLKIGGNNPIIIQSMTNTNSADVEATVRQINELEKAGCQLVRMTINNIKAAEAIKEIKKRVNLPLVADIHFDYRLALLAIENGIDKLRINPGNIGSMERVDAVIEAAKEAHIPIRIGVNAGSLAKEFDTRQDMTLVEKLVASSKSFVEHFSSRGFDDIVLSAKAHDVPTTLAVYRALSKELPQIPLHVGVTEAGALRQGTVKNSAAVGILLESGIGDTMRLSLTADPVEEVHVAWELLAALGMRRIKPELVSCPTCGRCGVDMIPIAEEVTKRLDGVRAPISVAVMGCVVNGPGEARGVDLGVACGKGQAVLFENGNPIRKVPEDKIVDELFAEIENRFGKK